MIARGDYPSGSSNEFPTRLPTATQRFADDLRPPLDEADPCTDLRNQGTRTITGRPRDPPAYDKPLATAGLTNASRVARSGAQRPPRVGTSRIQAPEGARVRKAIDHRPFWRAVAPSPSSRESVAMPKDNRTPRSSLTASRRSSEDVYASAVAGAAAGPAAFADPPLVLGRR